MRQLQRHDVELPAPARHPLAVPKPRRQRRRLFIREHRERILGPRSQPKLADRAGMSLGNLSLLERGEINYTQKNLELVAEALGLDVAQLFHDPTARGAQIYDILRHASPEERERLAEVAAVILKRPPN